MTFAVPLKAEVGAVAVRVPFPMPLRMAGPVIVTMVNPMAAVALVTVRVVFIVAASAIHDRVMHDRVMQASLDGTVFLVY